MKTLFLEVCIDCVAPIESPQELGLLKSWQALGRLEGCKLELGSVLGGLDPGSRTWIWELGRLDPGSRTLRRLKSDCWGWGGIWLLWLESDVYICEKLWLLQLRPLACD